MSNSEPSSPAQTPGPTGKAIIQIHPSLRCNLSCSHCYSSSGPMARTELEVATICDVITDAATLGYQVVSVSGGEPLIYNGLDEILTHAKSLGLLTAVTTNGFFTGQDQLDRLKKVVDVLAISLDGPAELHNKIRGSAQAFKRLEAGVENVRKAGIPFGFIHTLTQQNWEHLLWVAEFAAANGAHLLQIHPLELAGHAKLQMTGDLLDDNLLAKAYVLGSVLANKYSETMRVQLDLLYREQLREEPGLVYAEEFGSQPNRAPTTQALGVLVLEPDGTVVPISYGFSRRYKLCNVKEQSLAGAWQNYLRNGYPELRALCRQVWNELCAPEAPILSNWHEVIAARSFDSAA